MGNGSRATGGMVRKILIGVAAFATILSSPQMARSHDSSDAKGPAHAESKVVGEATAFGRPVKASEASRTIVVEMSDAMRFSPAEIRVARGERVRIVVRNSGRVLHEMVLGTREELERHAELMRRFPSMEHDEPYMAHVDPGATGEINWEFTKAGEFLYGCLIPGHFDAGMIGRIIVAI
jgi:uncharacterized cupredoxin-like copper-binding protein